MPAEPSIQHLSAAAVAAYVDQQVSGVERNRIEEHLADCRECRAEIVAVSRVVRKLRRPWRWAVLTPFAAAALVVVMLAPWHRDDQPVLREPAVTTIVAPTAITPRGRVAELSSITWSTVPRATQYEITVFDSAGTIVWETRVADSVAVVPRDLKLVRGRPYYWKVAARTESKRWVSSDFATFTLLPGVAR